MIITINQLRKRNSLQNEFQNTCYNEKKVFLANFLEYDSKARLSEINFDNDKILKILRSLDINKGHRHDDTSIRIMKQTYHYTTMYNIAKLY